MVKKRHNGTWEDPGGPTLPPHHVVAWGPSWPRQGQVRDPLALHLLHLLPLSLPFDQKLSTIAQTRVFAVLHCDFSISLLSPSQVLKFGAIALRYVTPPIIQVEFYLVDYNLSILVL